MKNIILAGLFLGAAHGMVMPAEAHNRQGRHHHHHHHRHNAPKHNHCHYHRRLDYSHCHKHSHGGPGKGHHGEYWIHPIPVWYPGSLQIHLDF